MDNPWLNIPLADYESHMSAPAVGQLTVLAELFAEALAARRPASVAILGVAGGNGLDRIDCACTARIVGVDCNPQYLEEVRARYTHLPGLELHCVDLAQETAAIAPVDLVHAALVFEHAGLGRCLENALHLVAAGGALSVVLQLPSAQTQAVAPTGVASIARLGSHFSFVDQTRSCAILKARGFALERERRCELPGGKAFWLGIFVS